MPVRQLITTQPETLSDFLLAADDRYRDGEELLVQQRFDASSYLFGYAAEMWLKAACLRLRGVGPTGPVRTALGNLKSWMKQNAPYVPFTDYHDLSYFANCVTVLRAAANRPLAGPVMAELQANVVNGLHQEWTVEMRYRRLGLTPAETWASLANAWWVRTNWLTLT